MSKNAIQISEIKYEPLTPISELKLICRPFPIISRDEIKAKEKIQAEEDRNIFEAISGTTIKLQNQELFRKYVKNNSVCILT